MSTFALIKEIIALNLSNLKNGQHFSFMEFVAAALNLYSIYEPRFSFFIDKFMEAFDHENEVYLKHDRKAMTKKINDADRLRDERFRFLRDAVKLAQSAAATQSGREAAEVLMGVISLYGGNRIPDMGMDDKSGVLTNLIEDLEDKYDAQIQALNLGRMLADLKAANIEFKQFVSLRTEADSEFGKNAMVDARTVTDRFYRMMITAFNQAYFETHDEKLSRFIDYLNTEIERYRIKIGQGTGNAEIGGTDGEGTVRTKTATFHYKNGNVVKMRIEVGAPIEAPENTEGYKWSPEVPEVMPAVSKTFREVPIVAEETTATFHFYDHTEEEVRQVVGTALVAPENTQGYHWEPEVPEVMPAEDSNYYELPDENNSDEGNGGTGSGGGNNGGTGNNPSTPTPDPDDDDEIPEGDDPWRKGK